MATRAKVTLTYADLKDLALEHVLAMCRNIAGKSTVPSTMRAGYIKQFTKDSGGANFVLSSNSAVYDVDEATIRIKFEQFMTASGISKKNTQVPTTRGLINFWNNVSSFCAAYLKIAASSFPEGNPDQCLIFDNSVNIASAKYTILNKEEEVITADDVNKSLEYIKNLATTTNTIKAMVYSIQSFSSCSSSSSSSSCSSSVFIGYMKLGD